MRVNNLIIAGLCILFMSSCATRKLIKEGDKLYDETSFFNAADNYEEAAQKKQKNSRLSYQLAQTNRHLKDYKQAEKWYAKTLELNEKAWPEAKFYYAQMLKQQGQYEEAKKEFKEYIDITKESKKLSEEEEHLKNWAGLEIEGCDLAIAMLEEKSYSEVTTMEEGLNNQLQDFSPTVVAHDKVLMGALLPDSAVNREEAQDVNDDYYTKLYFAEFNNGTWERELLPDNINADNKHVGNAVLTEDGNTMYFTMCEEEAAQTIVCNIYKSEKSGSTWSDPDAVSKLNKKGATSTQPSLGKDADGNDVIYFASNRTGSKGGMDIYYSVMDDDGDFSTPKSMGNDVNTSFDEMTPHYDNTNQTLYFSSNGHPGMGGLDVFKLDGNVDNWTGDVYNAGQPLNSSADDLYLSLNEAGTKGYVVSNRVGTTSNRGETCCDDVFKLKLTTDKYIAITTIIEGTEEILEGADVASYMIVEDDFELVAEGVSSETPNFVLAEDGFSYKVNASKEGYWPSITTVESDDIMAYAGDTMEYIVYLKPIVRLKVKNVYFAFDKDNIREMYKDEMDSVYAIMMDYPKVKVEISGHTDSKGSDSYNQALSERRANAARDYFLELDIAEDRIITQGFGESQPIAPNANPDGTDSPEGRAKNRRVEFKLKNEINEDFQIDVEYIDQDPETID
ncbi:MAG: OmpA family protein [Chitinophagales bacterium]